MKRLPEIKTRCSCRLAKKGIRPFLMSDLWFRIWEFHL